MSARDRLLSMRDTVRDILANPISILFAVIIFAYWIASPFLTGEYHDLAMQATRVATIAMTFGIAFSQFLAAARAIREGQTGSVAKWLTGNVVFFFAFSCIQVYSWVWVFMDRPVWMTVYPLLGFMMVWQFVGASMMVTAPFGGESLKAGFKLRLLWTVVVVAALGIGIAIGRLSTGPSVASSDIAQEHVCADDRPVWGNVNSEGRRIFHDVGSPYRALVKPERCFTSAEEAEEAGFRAPG